MDFVPGQILFDIPPSIKKMNEGKKLLELYSGTQSIGNLVPSPILYIVFLII